jgi:hypothetical protein
VDISGQYRIALPREEVWKALMEPSVLRRCVPGCESLEQIGPDKYRAKVALVIGPAKAVFDTELRVSNKKPPERYRLSGEGKGGALGFGQGNADIVLMADGTATVLKYTAGFQVGGRLAQIGSRLVLGASRMLVDAFFENLGMILGGGPVAGAAFGESHPGPARRLTLWLALAILLVTALVLWLLVSGNAA